MTATACCIGNAQVCFICSLKREVFERHRIIFSTHVHREHQPWCYMVRSAIT